MSVYPQGPEVTGRYGYSLGPDLQSSRGAANSLISDHPCSPISTLFSCCSPLSSALSLLSPLRSVRLSGQWSQYQSVTQARRAGSTHPISASLYDTQLFLSLLKAASSQYRASPVSKQKLFPSEGLGPGYI